MDRAAASPVGRTCLEMVWLELTTRCNLHCRHCYADAGAVAPLQGRMSLGDWLAAIDEAVHLGVSAIQLIGGEPTLHPHFRALLGHAGSHVGRSNLSLIEVYTNATRLTDAIVGCLKDNGARVAASFYAGEPEVHDSLTQRPGSWRRTVAGLERALAADLPVRVGIVETAENKGRVPEAIDFLRRLGIREIGVDGERRVGRGRRQAGGTAGNMAAEDISQLCGQCGRSRLCVTSTGAIYPCVFARRTPLGDIRHGLRSALDGAALAGFRAAMELELRSRRVRGIGSGFCDPGPPAPIPYPPDEPQPDTDGCGPWERARPPRPGLLGRRVA